MSESEFRELAWKSCAKRIVAMIEAEAGTWQENGQAKAVARALIIKINAMPVPEPSNG